MPHTVVGLDVGGTFTDIAVLQDGERVATIRRNLAAEPSVTGKRYVGLRPA